MIYIKIKILLDILNTEASNKISNGLLSTIKIKEEIKKLVKNVNIML